MKDRLIYVIYRDAVYPAKVTRGIANNRGVTIAYDVHIQDDVPGAFSAPTIMKKDAFNTEDEASKTLFIRKLKKEPTSKDPNSMLRDIQHRQMLRQIRR